MARKRSGDGKRTAIAPGTRGRWTLLLAALFAFSLQAVVAQMHRHPAPAAPVVATHDSGARIAAPGAPGDTPASCPICQELAHAAFYLPSAPPVFTAPVQTVAPFVASAQSIPTLRSRPVGWRSRAPPLLLQA